ncbi:MAG TPA: nucleotidyltransferase family protein [Usitatibacter sp.]|nr:nucleotidyltransferase family protein [Usitatibacter sp.]
MLRTLLLCGGRSSRFGSDKLLARITRGGVSAEMALVAAQRALQGAGPVTAVIPLEAARLRKLLEPAGCEILETADTVRGLGASLAAGVSHTSRSDGWIVALGDMPFIEAATFEAIARALRDGALIAAPILPDGKRGHPVGFSKELRAELVALDGDEGARSVIQRHVARLVSIPVTDRGIVIDIDTPGDLAAAN